jgi:hypothetical protein
MKSPVVEEDLRSIGLVTAEPKERHEPERRRKHASKRLII